MSVILIIGFAQSNSYAALPGVVGGGGSMEFKVEWKASIWYLCFFGSAHNCSVTIKIPGNVSLTNSIAEGILGYSIPPTGTAVVLQSPENFQSAENGMSGETSEHIYSPGCPELLEGILDASIIFPAQTMVFSSQFNGFIGWYLVQ